MSLAKIEQAKKRISSINWNCGVVVKEGSHILLFKEFLRRAALLVESFGTLDIPGSMWPILDFAAYIDSSLELDDDEIDSLAEDFQVKGWLTDKSLSQKAEMLWRVGIDKPQGEPAFWNQKPLINQNA
jgi:hypothetical protein